MKLSRWSRISLLVAVVLSGCKWQSHPEEKPKPAPISPTAESKVRLQRLAPGTPIGRIVAVLPADRLASIADLPVNDFSPGTVLTIIGGEDTPLAEAEVISTVKDTLHVKYTQGSHSPRAPMVGDLAIRLKN